jgi:Tol biopolymer transport system component
MRFVTINISLFILILTLQASENLKDGVIEWIKAPDSKTGNEVWQITNHDSLSVAVYFEQQAFTSDDRYVVFASNRTDEWYIYRADLTTGEIVQVTKNKSISPSTFTIHPDGEHVWYMNNKILYKTNVASLKEDVVIDFSKTFSQRVNFSSSFTSDGKYTLITASSDSGKSIYRIDLETGKIERALLWTEGSFSHPLICPTNPDFITFVPGPDTQNDMSLPMEKRARTWTVNMKNGEVKQFLTMPYGFRATHETFSADGKRFFFFKKERPKSFPITICSVDLQGNNWQEHYTHEKIALAHGVSSADGKWFLTDGDDPNYNPLILFNLKTGEDIFLCWPNSSIKRYGQFSHVHPSLSKSGRFACYTSDVSGKPQVYVVPIPKNIDFSSKQGKVGLLFRETDGTCVMEAEQGIISQNGDKVSWVVKSDSTASNGAYATTPYVKGMALDWDSACDLTFPVLINSPGTYRIAVRLIAERRNNSAKWGLDGHEIRPIDFEHKGTAWIWSRSSEMIGLVAGGHTIHIRRREAGWKIDQVMITQNPEGFPTSHKDETPKIEPPQGYGEVWPMHEIDNPQYRLPNGLDPADLNQDGFLDFVTNYEAQGQVRVAFHPGQGDVRKPWPTVEITKQAGMLSNAESAAFGDFDGDGRPDVVVSKGSERPGEVSGLYVLWCPATGMEGDSSAWTDMGIISASRDVGHFHYVKSYDVNGDGAVDVVAGGRQSEINKSWGGLRWFEAPRDKEQRRDLTQWIMHDIDAALLSGHGFEFGDLDGDGDEDIAVANADWDTPDEEDRVIWYENPGPGSTAQKQPWTRNVIYEDPEFYVKPQVDIADLNGDGWNDIVTITATYIYYFENLGSKPARFKKIAIEKPPVTKWLQRGIEVGDVNSDGKPDIVGMLIWNKVKPGKLDRAHALEEGYTVLPRDKAAVFWMEFNGDDPEMNNWTTHVIKWGDGFLGWQAAGEKWDQCLFYDVDGDGDLDIVANCEEYHNSYRVYLTVVWFENPGL